MVKSEDQGVINFIWNFIRKIEHPELWYKLGQDWLD